MAEMQVVIQGGLDPTTGNVVNPLPVSGSISGGTVTANQGTSNTIPNGWYMKITDGTRVALVDTNGAQLVSQGSITASTPAAITANGSTASVDFGSAKSNWTAVCAATGSPTAGTITLELSVDGITFVSSTVTASVTAAGNFLLASTGRAARYARVTLSGLTGTISLSCSFMAAG